MLKELVDGVLPIGGSNAAYWRYYLGDSFPLFRIPYAVDNRYFQNRAVEATAGRHELLHELKLDAARPVILFASKLKSGNVAEIY